MANDIDDEFRNIQREYLDFLDDDGDQGTYSNLVKQMINNKKCRLIVNINDLRKKNPLRANAILKSANIEVLAFQNALKEFVSAADATYAKDFEEFFIGFEGSFGNKHVTPRTLSSRYLGNLVCLEGIVTRCSLIRPKVVRSVHYCPQTTKTMERRYSDFTSLDPFPTSAAYPTKDEDGNLLETEFGLSCYKDHQTFTIQEMPEKAPPGQLPRSIDIIVDNDLVDVAKPGDRVQIIGIYRCLPSKQGGFTAGTFRTILISNQINLLSKELAPRIFADDVKKCKKFVKAKGNQVFDTLAHSLAPSIHGHEFIKKALLCMLLGGVEKVLPNGTRLRGDINILLIGDPSVAKSQLLRYVLQTAPRAITTTGRGSSGVGLTAAVTTDHETGDRRLEAGAMVLADRGVVCIDEFDKMSDIDRTAIHEVMEQGRVSISKAGIHAKLNARCSVLAAANPVFGRYDQYKTPMENIGLQDSLLSRFDLLFIMLDTMDPDNDREISDHVVRMHRYRKPYEREGEPMPIDSGAEFLATKSEEVEEEESETPIYEKHEPLLHGRQTRKEKIVSIEFMKKYIHIAKVMKPTLTQDACNAIAEEYSRLRAMESEHTELAKTQPVTARALETLIRLATAHAKARLSRSVEEIDAQAAIELVQFAYFKKVIEKRKKHKGHDEDSAEEMEEDDDEEIIITQKKRKAPADPKKPRKQPGDEGYDPYDFEEIITEDEEEIIVKKPKLSKEKPKEKAAEPVEPLISNERMKTFRILLDELFSEQRSQILLLNHVIDYFTLKETIDPFTPEEINMALEIMTEANQVMVAEGQVFKV